MENKEFLTREYIDTLWDKAAQCYSVGDFKTAFEALGELAGKGFAPAQFQCGIMYESELYVSYDEEKALYWFEAAATQGHPDAMFKCGAKYCYGRGTEQDFEKALYWYERAAEAGNTDAMFQCGIMYDTGKGTEINKKKSMYWYQKATEASFGTPNI